MKSVLSLLCLVLLLSACGNNKRQVHIVTNYSKITSAQTDSGMVVTLSEPGLYETAKEVECEGKTLLVAENGQRWPYELPEGGHYVINLLEDTLFSVPVSYRSATAFDFGPEQQVRPTHTGNPGVDSATARMARAQEKNRDLKEKEQEKNGRSTTQILLPGKMVRVSRNGSAQVFVFTRPPEEVRGTSANDFEYYQVNKSRYFIDRALKELEERGDPAKQMERRDKAIREMLDN